MEKDSTVPGKYHSTNLMLPMEPCNRAPTQISEFRSPKRFNIIPVRREMRKACRLDGEAAKKKRRRRIAVSRC
jgi:hypothetical protein